MYSSPLKALQSLADWIVLALQTPGAQWRRISRLTPTSSFWGQYAAFLYLFSRRPVGLEKHLSCILGSRYHPLELWSSTVSGQTWEAGGLPGLHTDGRDILTHVVALYLHGTVRSRPPALPMTFSLMVNRLSPALFLATHSYTPASRTVMISRMKECIPFSHTNILWKSSGQTALPSKYQVTSGIGRPPTCSG